ncbi:thiol S-methyltransferase TMT1B-like isoform X3 [Amphiura filiformis]|uniref:thiol S-methyltransferase TMT1B-like isoform X3 n=1 Tax=Amphiura filiformis TaxID=82378 RepID=UPI003B223CD3
MASLDKHIAQLIRQYGPYVVGLFIMYKITASMVIRAYPYGYAWFLNRLADRYNRGMWRQKEELFTDLPDIKKQFEKGADVEEKFTILEIGVGSGANFKYYPEGTSVIAIEPKEQFQTYLEENADQFPGVKITEVVWCNAEDMKEVPDESVSAVVCTLVLCSVLDIDLVLKEVKRVLKSGGRFYFMEHVFQPERSFTHYTQRLLNPLQVKFGDNCHLTRETWKNIDKAGFAEVRYKRFSAYKMPSIIRPHLMGTATK